MIIGFAQERVITGTVTDEQGETLIGVNILIKGTARGTVTDFDDNFELTVPHADNILVVSYAGFTLEEVAAGNNAAVDIA